MKIFTEILKATPINFIVSYFSFIVQTNYLNSLHHSIEFTIECEENNIISFLDLQLIKNRDSGMLDITVYRKPTHSGVFTNYTSFVPRYFKVGLVKTLVCRAYQICSTVVYKTIISHHREKRFLTRYFALEFTRFARKILMQNIASESVFLDDCLLSFYTLLTK